MKKSRYFAAVRYGRLFEFETRELDGINLRRQIKGHLWLPAGVDIPLIYNFAVLKHIVM